jgi:MFS family permease
LDKPQPEHAPAGAGVTRADLTRIGLAGFARSLGVGMTGVVLLFALAQGGLQEREAFLVLAAGLVGSAVGLALAAWHADRIGRRRTLMLVSGAQTLGGTALALCAGSFPLALAAAFVGMVNGMGRDRGPALAVEQALLPSATDERGRTGLFARYHVVLDLGHGLGALLGLLPGLYLAFSPPFPSELAERATLALLGVLGAVSFVCHARLGPGVEAGTSPIRAPLSPRTRAVVARISGLFALDSLGGGFLPNALLALWFFHRFGLDPGLAGVLFAVGRAANAASYLAAAWLAARIGLVRTMVFTHVPSSLVLLALPLVDSLPLAVALYLLRELLVEMDLPTRQSYVMAVVAPAERTRVAGLTGLVRAAAWATGALVAAHVVPSLGLTAPLVIGASVKILYDLLLYVSLVSIRPPEET